MVTTYIPEDGGPFFDLIGTYLCSNDIDRVRDAFEFARVEHGDQRRKSGELFFTHPLTVAYYLAEYQLDASALCAALMHDVAEDTRVSLAEIATKFGADVAAIVDGVTKFEQSAADRQQHGKLSAEQQGNLTLHKLFQSMTDDVRAVLIKLMDRLHNMRTMGSMPMNKQVKKANETLYVYAPLANRLGMWQIKNELESRSLRILNYRAYEQIVQQVEKHKKEQKPLFKKVNRKICNELKKANIDWARIEPSPRNVHSLYKKAVRNGDLQYHVDNIPRLVIVVKDTLSCYKALGVVHQLWQPTPGQFDDYIARPRENLYKALHTTVVHENGMPLKIRFRTEAMSIMSEIGVLARWADTKSKMSEELAFEVAEQVNSLIDRVSDNIGDVRGLVEDVLGDQITIITPRGDTKTLPRGSTPIDFAYSIHTDVGHSCHRAFVDEMPVPLNDPLKEGARVRIATKGKAPERLWLDVDLGYLNTNRSKGLVRRWFRRLTPESAEREGRELLVQELEMLGLSAFSHEVIAEWLEHETLGSLYHDLGRAELLPTAVSTRILSDIWHEGRHRQVGKRVVSDSEIFFVLGAGSFNKIKLCRNCCPRPGNKILGYVRKSGMVTVHEESCHQLPGQEHNQKLLRLRWGVEENALVRQVTVKIYVNDRPNLLYEITDLLRQETVNIAWISTPHENKQLVVELCLEVLNPRQLVRLVHRMNALVNVKQVRCEPYRVPSSAKVNDV